jgi:hypothetical protein
LSSPPKEKEEEEEEVGFPKVDLQLDRRKCRH